MPADSESTLPRRWRPMGTTLAAWFLYGAVVFVSLFAWWAFGPEIRDRFSEVSIAVTVFWYVMMGVAVHALARSRLDADESGLTVVNGFRKRRFAWAQALHITMPPGAPWAVLDLADGTAVPVMALQATDGPRARDAVRDVRALLER